MRIITGYRLTVARGARIGLVREYQAHQRNAATRFADRLDQEHGAICTSVVPLFGESQDRPFRCSAARIASVAAP